MTKPQVPRGTLHLARPLTLERMMVLTYHVLGRTHMLNRWKRSNRIHSLMVLPDEWHDGVAVNYRR